MEKIRVDSYGQCLQNSFSHTTERMKGNINLYSKYKFVIAIENSNCQDYVTEKLVHAVASGSIPIVAGRNGKPDYLKFLPNNSFINIYDYKTVDDLVVKLNSIAFNKTEYEKYINFKFFHNYTRDYLAKLPLKKLIETSKTIIDKNEIFFSQLIAKETSQSKLCKVARYLRNTPKEKVKQEILLHKRKRLSISEACLQPGNIFADFKLS
jgi:hypothetical protein